DAVEHLTRFDDAPRGAGLEAADHAASGAVDAGQPEHLHPAATRGAEIEPGPLRFGAAQAALGEGPDGRLLIDPGAFGVAVDADGGEIADPGEIRQRGDVVGEIAQYGVAFQVWRDADEQMRGP